MATSLEIPEFGLTFITTNMKVQESADLAGYIASWNAGCLGQVSGLGDKLCVQSRKQENVCLPGQETNERKT